MTNKTKPNETETYVITYHNNYGIQTRAIHAESMEAAEDKANRLFGDNWVHIEPVSPPTNWDDLDI